MEAQYNVGALGLMETIIVICTLNEADNIARVLYGLSDYTVLMVDARSNDGTPEIARSFQNVKVVSRPNHGVAAAYLYGLKTAIEFNPRFVVQMSAGMTHNPQDIPRLIDICKRRAELVIGSRFLKFSWRQIPTKQLYRPIVDLGAAWFMRRLGVPVRDATSGFWCWRYGLLKQVVRNHPIVSRGFAFQLELLYYARQAGVKIEECPIEYRLTNGLLNWGEALRTYRGLVLK